MQHISQASPPHVIRNCFQIWACSMCTHPSHTHTNSQREEMWKGKREVGGGSKYFSDWRLSLYSLSLSVLNSIGLLNVAPDMNLDPFHFLRPLEGDAPPPPSCLHLHTPEMPHLPPRECFLPASLCVCVWGDFVLHESEKDPLPVSNCLSHSTLSLKPPCSGYFFLFLAPSLFPPLSMRSFVCYQKHKKLIHSRS